MSWRVVDTDPSLDGIRKEARFREIVDKHRWDPAARRQLPELRLEDLFTGKARSLSDWKGKFVVVHVTNLAPGPRHLLDGPVKTLVQTAEGRDDLVFMNVLLNRVYEEGEPEGIKEHLQENVGHYGLDRKGIVNLWCVERSKNETVFRAFNVESFPILALLDKEGRVVTHEEGFDPDGQTEVLAAVARFVCPLKTEPDVDPAALLEAATAKKKKGDFAGALADYGRLVVLDSKNPVVWNNRADVRRLMGDLEGAISDATRAIELDPACETPRIVRGLAKNAKGDFDGAVADADAALALAPNSAMAYAVRGQARLKKGDADGAIADQTRAIDIDPGRVAFYMERSNARQQKHDMDGAVADIAKIIELDPAHAAPQYTKRGFLNYDRRSFKEAIFDFRRATQLAPAGEPYARVWLWLARARLGERAEATKELLSQFKQAAKGAEWVTTIARFLGGQATEAELLTAARSNDAATDRGQRCEAYFYAGSKLLIDGQKDAARERFKKCLDAVEKDFAEHLCAELELKALGK